VENSVDAGAKKISIEITNDCRNIRIADNGCGIHPDDILLAFTKHATSKIKTDEDLFDIHTLGFRGEALASIISISRLTCTTRTAEFETGTKVKCENSEVNKVETGCAVGTIMDIKDLFYNIPARLKFLKSASTEFSYIQELLQSIALANPDVAFELKRDGKTTLKTTGLGDLKRTIKELFNAEVTDNLKEVLKTDKIAGMQISGYVSTPDFTRSSKKNYYMFINKRAVKCPVFQKSIDNAYKNLIASGKYPFVVLNLEIPPADVDVNVHPTKKEVRYKNTNMVFNFIYTAIQGGLTNYVEKPFAEMSIRPEPSEFREPVGILNFPKSETGEIYFDKTEDSMYVSDNMMEKISQSLPFKREETVEQAKLITHVEKEPEPEENIIGQYKNTYILIERDEGLEIVDQHIAEERYIYEKLKSEKNVVSQLLFVSDVLTVSSAEAELIKENIEKFEKFGYGIEFLKENELIFRKVPQLIAKVNPKEILSEILENIEGDIDGLEEKILITTSCKASVKAGQKLSTWQMQEIIKRWRTTKMPYTCPHGRPISKILPHKQIASFFQRQS
ncbi:TPA: DNA mismatch repair endonuclease MutL, partial [Candidatus Scatenecus faecavium]|nr:DNA mismatch repair endonuclease MutL [Candidatus Scatenecus faecavium]